MPMPFGLRHSCNLSSSRDVPPIGWQMSAAFGMLCLESPRVEAASYVRRSL